MKRVCLIPKKNRIRKDWRGLPTFDEPAKSLELEQTFISRHVPYLRSLFDPNLIRVKGDFVYTERTWTWAPCPPVILMQCCVHSELHTEQLLSFCISFFNTLPLHSLKYNSQQLKPPWPVVCVPKDEDGGKHIVHQNNRLQAPAVSTRSKTAK